MDPVETVTVLFTDLVGSTGMALRIGPAAAEELRREHFGLLREAIDETGGEEVKNLGDGLMVTFDSASAALSGASLMQRRITRRNRRADENLSIRVGVSLGEATRVEGDYFGPPVIEASRLCAAAEGDEVLVSDLVRTMARGRGHEFRPAGELRLKGMDSPVMAFRLAWQAADDDRMPLPARLRGVPPAGFVGREAERARLGEIAAETEAGSVHLALVSGEPGIGKTRLAAHTALELHGQGAAVLFGRCAEGLDAPHRAWAEALSHYVECGPQRVIERHVERHGGELARLAPGLADRVEGLPAPRATDSETERYLLRSAALGLLEEAAREQLVVVVLDDLQWADSQTLALLKHLVTSLAEAELLVIGTHRDSELAQGHPLRQLLGDLRREERVERIALKGLRSSDVGALMQGAIGQELPEEGRQLAEEISRETDGNPFFVAEILRHLDESGDVAPDQSGRWGLTRSLAEIGLPQSVREVVTSRAERLGGQVASLLSTASVFGRDFELGLLAQVAGRDPDELLDALEAAERAALVQEGRTPGHFSFAHSLVNHTLYESLGPTRQAQAHRLIAEALEEAFGADPGERSAELALHWLKATAPQRPDKAARYCIAAGNRALEELAPAEAMSWFERAIEVQDQAGEFDRGERCDALIGLGDAQRQAGSSSYSETLLEAAELARRLSDGNRMARAAEANNRGFGSINGQVDQRRVDALRGALELCEDDARRSSLLSLLAVELSYEASLEERIELSGEAVRLARRSGDQTALVWALTRRQGSIAAPDTLAERREEAEEMIALADRLGDPVQRYWAYAWHGFCVIDAGDVGASARARAVQEEIAEETGQPAFHWVNTFALIILACLAGEFDEAEAMANKSAQLGAETGQPDVLSMYAAQLFQIRYEQGRLDELIPVAEQAVKEAPLLEGFLSSLALSYCEVGRDDDARRILEEFSAEDFRIHPNLTTKVALCHLAEVAARIGDCGASEALYARLLPCRGQCAYSGVSLVGPVDRTLGLLATCMGRHREAEEHFEGAVEWCEATEAPTWLARTRHEWALMLRHRGAPGDGERAEQMLEEALAAASAYGCRALERSVEAALRPSAAR